MATAAAKLFSVFTGRGASAFDPLSLDPLLYLDASTGVLKTGGSAAGFRELVAAWSNPGTGSDATQATSGSQPLYLPLIGGAGYLNCPGVNGNGASVPDAAPLDITGDITIDVQVTVPSWTPATLSALVNKQTFTDNQRSYSLSLKTDGSLAFYTSSNGLSGGTVEVASSVAVSGSTEMRWLRVIVDVDADVRFYTSTVANPSADLTDWAQLGATVAGALGARFSGTAPVGIGTNGALTDPLRGAIHRARIYASTNGTDKRLDIDFTDPVVSHGATSFACSTAQTVTINRTGTLDALLLRHPVVRPDAVDDTMAGTAPSDIASDILISCYRARSGNTRGIRQSLVSASSILSNTGTSWTLVSGAFDHELAYVVSAATPAGSIAAAKAYFSNLLSAPIL